MSIWFSESTEGRFDELFLKESQGKWYLNWILNIHKSKNVEAKIIKL